MAEKTQRAELLGTLARGLRKLGVETFLFNQAVADRIGINHTDLKCASILSLDGAMTAGKLAEVMGLTTGAITGVIDRLEKANIVERAADPNDRRRVIIQPLATRDREVEQLFGAIADPLANLYARYSDEQLDVILDFISRNNAAFAEGRARLLREEKPSQSPDAAADAQEVFSTPLGSTTRGRLEFARGASHMEIRSVPHMPELYQARFNGPSPTIKVDRGTVAIQYRRPTLAEAARLLFGGGQYAGSVTLNGEIPWEVDVRGGLVQLRADLRALTVTSFSVTGGVNDVEVSLPAPVGLVPVRIQGGANKLVLHRPAGTAARIQVVGGASKLTFDDQYLGAIGGELALESSTYRASSNRYDVLLAGGASLLTLDTR